MLRLPYRTSKSVAEPSLEPDRTGTIHGLSLTGFHEVAYVDWGPLHAAVPVVCVHGLSRQGRDFDYLAADLAASGRRVICPDLVGRGRSGRLRNPTEYALPQYCADINALLAEVGAEQVDWVGTSLGGLIGIVLAGLPGSPIRQLVVNDIGPFLPWEGLARIGSYLSAMPADFHDLGEVEAYFREVLAPFGDLPDEHWSHITRHSVAWHPIASVTSCSATRKSFAPFATPGTTASISGNTGWRSKHRSLLSVVRIRICCRPILRAKWFVAIPGQKFTPLRVVVTPLH